MEIKRLIATILLASISLTSAYADDIKPNDNNWKGTSVSAGGSVTSGNSSVVNFNLGSNIVYVPNDKWLYNGSVNYIYNRDRSTEVTSSDKLTALAGARYSLTKHDGIYANIYYLKDMLGEYTYYVTESIGYSRILIDKEDLKWDVDAGPSLTQKKERTTGKTFNDLGALAATNVNWQISDSANLLENFRVNYTKSGTLFTNKVTLALKIYENLGAQISFEANYNTNVQGNNKKLDTITTFALVYNF